MRNFLDRITFDPNVMGEKPCIRGMRVTVGTIVGLIGCGATHLERWMRLRHKGVRRVSDRS
jgi:uncharacterized protein (DUF433 family)